MPEKPEAKDRSSARTRPDTRPQPRGKAQPSTRPQPSTKAQPSTRPQPSTKAQPGTGPTMKRIPKRVSTKPSRTMETFANPKPGRDYEIEIHYPEFTCVCPMTGQPDFAKLHISYVPGETCVELKSLRNYLWSYRNKGVFHEAVTNKIADDLTKLLDPRWLLVEAEFQARGGINTTVRVEVAGGET